MKITTSLGNIDKAIAELRAYKKELERKNDEFVKRLAEIGADVAEDRFGAAMYDGNNDVVVTVERSDNGYMIVASGQAVAFIEFGSGVFWNPDEPHPARPPGVAGIGQYGKGWGMRQGWKFNPGDGGKAQFTRGNPASLAMWGAREKIISEVVDIAREVFG